MLEYFLIIYHLSAYEYMTLIKRENMGTPEHAEVKEPQMVTDDMTEEASETETSNENDNAEESTWERVEMALGRDLTESEEKLLEMVYESQVDPLLAKMIAVDIVGRSGAEHLVDLASKLPGIIANVNLQNGRIEPRMDWLMPEGNPAGVKVDMSTGNVTWNGNEDGMHFSNIPQYLQGEDNEIDTMLFESLMVVHTHFESDQALM